LLAAVNFNQMDKEQELQEIAEMLMQSENLAASVEILRQFADKCWQEGACEAQNDTAKYINEHTVNYRDIPNVLFTNGGRF
jgi:hypothetical protein